MKYFFWKGFKLRLRKPAMKLAYRRRFSALTSMEQVKLNRLKQAILAVCVRDKLRNTARANRTALKALISTYLHTSLEVDTMLEKPANFHRTIESFSSAECVINFGFHKEDLPRLLHLLNFPNEIHFENRAKMTGEEVFLRGMFELVTGETQHQISTVFGRELTAQSRSFVWFIDHIYDHYHHLVHDNLHWWYRNGFFQRSADAIGAKMAYRPGWHNVVAHFIDCNCLPTCVTGGGPAEDGANAARWDATIQRAFYNGWKSVHGLKHQTLDNAYGMTVDMCGPTSLRRNDLRLLAVSNINDRLAALQVDDEIDFVAFGDSAYHRKSHLLSYLTAEDNIAEEIRC